MSKDTPVYFLLLSLVSGIILSCSWLLSSIFIGFAFIPIIYIMQKLALPATRHAFGKGLLYSFPAFLIWNGAVTWWIWNSTQTGAIAAIILNALLMSWVVACWFFYAKRTSSYLLQAAALVVLWLLWEKLHLTWDLMWPWLNLGNVFAAIPRWVQWYEFTGALGGTAWILIMNFVLYYAWKTMNHGERSQKIKGAVSAALVVFLPVFLSFCIYHQQKNEISANEPIEVVVLQQNIDPWVEQYRYSNYDHTFNLLCLANASVTNNTSWIIAAESAIPHTVQEKILFGNEPYSQYQGYEGFDLMKDWTKEKNVDFFLGMSTIQFFDHKASATARDRGNGTYCDFYNTSAKMNQSGICKVYHKSKLVPGVEKMPFPKVFSFLENIVIDLGGTSGSLGKDTAQIPFVAQTKTLSNDTILLGVPICYESIFGDLFAEFVRNGANVMAIITNDSWWGNTPGHQQHFQMAKLRAIETRRWIARAANTGISGFIDPLGKAHQQTEYGTKCAIRGEVVPLDEITFYVKHGDWIAKWAVILLPFLIIGAIFEKMNRKRKKM